MSEITLIRVNAHNTHNIDPIEVLSAQVLLQRAFIWISVHNTSLPLLEGQLWRSYRQKYLEPFIKGIMFIAWRGDQSICLSELQRYRYNGTQLEKYSTGYTTFVHHLYTRLGCTLFFKNPAQYPQTMRTCMVTFSSHGRRACSSAT